MTSDDALRRKAEALARGKGTLSAEDLDALSPEAARHTIHELRVHQIELEIQNEELRRTQLTLDAARARYFDLYDLAPVGYITVSEQGLILEANLTAATLLGVPRGALVRRPFSQFILTADQDIYYRLRKKILETLRQGSLRPSSVQAGPAGEPQVCELRMLKNGGTAFWARLEASTALDEGGASFDGGFAASPPDGGFQGSSPVGGFPGPPVCRIVLSDITGRKLSEEALRASETRFRAIINVTPVPMALNDEQQHITFLNPAFVHTFGYTHEDIPTLAHWWPVACPDLAYRQWVADTWQAELEHAKQTGAAFSPLEITVRCKNGTSKSVLASAASFSNSYEGSHLVVLYDITERKQAAEALRDANWRLESIIEGTHVGAWKWNVQTGETVFNEVWAQIVGYTLGELAPVSIKTWETLTHPDDLKQSAELLERHVAGELAYYDCECRMKHKDGHWVWVHDRGRVITRTGDGKPLLMFGTHADITERKRAEEALRESEAKFRAMVETIPLAIHLSAGVEQISEYLNPEFIKLFGYTLEDVPTIEQWRPKAYPDEEYRGKISEEWTRRIKRAIETQSPFEPMEVVVTCKDGSTKNISWGYITLGEKNYSCGLDLTERKRAEEQTAKFESQLQQAQKMESVGRLAGGVAHDFNNMLSVILGHAELALDQVDPSHPLHADLEEVRKAASRSADLTRQLLAFARKQTIAPKVLDLNETIAGMLKMLEPLIGEDIHLRWQPAADLWPVRVDPSQIDQILANLCVNARDAISGVGRMTVETENSTLDEDCCAAHAGFVPGEYVRLAVSDDGCGMEPDTLAHIFEPFFTTKVMGKGTGLGLATVYGIVKQNNGFIHVYSEPGQGTTFKIYVPRHVGKAGQARTDRAAEPAPRGHETILLVEDEPAILKLTTTMLERQGYTVLAAGTPGEAIGVARELASEIHILMTDVVMPEMDGRDLAEHLLALYPHLKRLFMSGYTADVIAQHGVLEEGVSFIQKPFSLNELAAKVREAMG